MTGRELRQVLKKQGIPVFLLANLCLVETWEVEAWKAGRAPIPESVVALLDRMHKIPRGSAKYRDWHRS